MKVAGWVEKFRYSNVEYWYSTSSIDPISRYSFVAGVLRDSARRKAEVATAIKDELKLPPHVRKRALEKKGNPA